MSLLLVSKNNDFPIDRSVMLLFLVRPEQPLLEVSDSPLMIAENEEREISCTVPEARPAARIRWFLGTEDVTASSTAEQHPIDDVVS